MEDDRHHQRALWRSRRGMLELDVLLQRFARERYPRLDAGERAAYRALLDLDDWTLLDWLAGRQAPSAACAGIVGRIVAFNGGAPDDGAGASDLALPADPRRDLDVRYVPGWEWFGAVVAIHVLATVPWTLHFGPWPLLPAALSLLHYGRVFRRREVWRFALVEESVVLFEPAPPSSGAPPPSGARPRGGTARIARLRGPPWMTARWLVVRTSRRVLVLPEYRYDADVLARLRRGLARAAGAR